MSSGGDHDCGRASNSQSEGWGSVWLCHANAVVVTGALFATTVVVTNGCRSHDMNSSPTQQSYAGPKSPKAPRGKMMTIEGPVLFHQTELLGDVAAIALGEVGHLVTVEHTYDLVESSYGVSSEKTVWRFWRLEESQEHARFREYAKSTVEFPIATSVVVTLSEDRMIALAEVNQREAAMLLSWETANQSVPLEGLQPKVTHLGLNQEQAAQVLLRPSERWSTAGLRDSEWLFHPNLTSLPHSTTAAMNTADGRAVLWSLSEDGAARPIASIPRALNPALALVSGTRYVLYRQMPEKWPVFFHDTRYSGQFGPVALPLTMVAMDDSLALVLPSEPAKAWVLQDVFDFVVGTSEQGQVALAVITGSAENAELRVLAIEGPEMSLRLLYAAPVQQVPYRMTMAVMGSGLLLGLAQKLPTGYDISGLVIPWSRPN